MSSSLPRADRKIDALYEGLRGRYGTDAGLYNGYRSEAYFRREQRMVLAALRELDGSVLDVGCGSGIMVAPLARDGRLVLGLDFNAHACAAARSHGVAVSRGDAFSMPFADGSVDQILSCQFFNQQEPAAVRRFVHEAARCIRPGGRLVLVWRNGRAWVHRVAHAVLMAWDRVARRPTFPNRDHSLGDVVGYAREAGLLVGRREVTFPQWGWRTEHVHGIRARLLGASCFLVLVRPSSTSTGSVGRTKRSAGTASRYRA